MGIVDSQNNVTACRNFEHNLRSYLNAQSYKYPDLDMDKVHDFICENVKDIDDLLTEKV